VIDHWESSLSELDINLSRSAAKQLRKGGRSAAINKGGRGVKCPVDVAERICPASSLRRGHMQLLLEGYPGN